MTDTLKALFSEAGMQIQSVYMGSSGTECSIIRFTVPDTSVRQSLITALLLCYAIEGGNS